MINDISRKKYHQKWRDKNREKTRESYKRWYDKNKKQKCDWQRKYRKDNLEKVRGYFRKYQISYYIKDKYKRRAREILHNAVKYKKVKKPSTCEKCSNKNVQAHHLDYSKPLEVVWVCRSCHENLHHKTND